MPDLLRARDAGLVELPCGNGSVLLPPSLNGRIFCQLNGELIHRLDREAWLRRSPSGYDNLGGNSLWPAPEGGDFAFNYPPGGGDWLVQDGIALEAPAVMREGPGTARVTKRLTLTNRRGTILALEYLRQVSVPPRMEIPGGYALDGMRYDTMDTFIPLSPCPAAEVLLAPWSLEQFPGADGVVAFGKVAGGPAALNCDFYGDPGARIAWGPDGFAFRLGGVDRHQIGLRVGSRPELIGTLDPGRSLLILRRTAPVDGTYFNIADNDQPGGPFSAADLYSIFNGGELGFHELETVGAMRVGDGLLAASELRSRTEILSGPVPELLRWLREREGFGLGELLDAGGAA